MAPLVAAPYGSAMAGRKVLVTGAHGLLGSWLTRRLVELGADLTVLRLNPQPLSPLVLGSVEAQCEVVDGDLLDADLLERTVAGLRAAGLEPCWPQRIPTNDGGLALGQVIAAARVVSRS